MSRENMTRNTTHTQEDRVNFARLQQTFKEMRDDQDLLVEENFGSVASVIAYRSHLSRNLATFFIFIQFARRSVQAFIVLWFYTRPVFQIVLTLVLNLLYSTFIFHARVYRSKQDQFFESLNEVVVLLTIYCLMMFTGFVTEAKMTDTFGLVMICLTIGNFAINTIPIVLGIYKWARVRYLRYKVAQALKRRGIKDKKMLKYLENLKKSLDE